jgi:hypothetical protein
MKKVLIVAAAAGLMTLAACTPAANNTATADNTDVANTDVYNDVAEPLPADNAVTNAADTGNAADMGNMSGNAM